MLGFRLLERDGALSAGMEGRNNAATTSMPKLERNTRFPHSVMSVLNARKPFSKPQHH
jgi:hypothetical protein